MIKKLSRDEVYESGRPFLVRFMDALDLNDLAGIDVSRIVGDGGSTFAGYIEGDHQRDDVTGLLVKQA